MDYRQNARLTVPSREQLARYVIEQGGTLKAAAAAFNVSDKTAAKWVRRFRERGRGGMRDRNSKPHCSPRQTSSSLLEGFWFFAGSAGTAGASPTSSNSAGLPCAASCVGPE
jgi:hypothetical protein